MKNRKDKKICFCGHEFTPVSNRQVYCSKECKTDYHQSKSKKKTLEKVKTCRHCGGRYKMKSKQFCSDECKQQHIKNRKPHTLSCQLCKSEYKTKNKNQKYCSKKCKYLAHSTERTEKMCNYCGKTYVGKKCTFVCKSCSKELNHTRRVKKNQKYRSRKKGLFVENIDAVVVFKRDQYKCQLCGKKTRPDYNFNHDLYPHMDHIIPLSRGGTHEYANVQCACHKCNITKRASLLGQLRLF